jgi:hypothetical protein
MAAGHSASHFNPHTVVCCDLLEAAGICWDSLKHTLGQQGLFGKNSLLLQSAVQLCIHLTANSHFALQNSANTVCRISQCIGQHNDEL